MNNQDLRVVKTRRNIKKTFCEMLKSSPVEKISVTALSRQAQINKGTFYLHYQDIYALYREVREDFLEEMVESMDYCSFLLSDPEEFLKRITGTIRENADKINFLWPEHDMVMFQPNLNDRIIEKIYESCPIEKNIENDMALVALIVSVFELSFEFLEDEPQSMLQVLLKMTKAFFPVTG